jgi:uncharacterized SAM-binding protein YcdF (DUF218 family)
METRPGAVYVSCWQRTDSMDFFFIASKVGWFLLTPSNLILLALLIGAGLLIWERTRLFGMHLAGGGAIAAVVVVLLPLGDWLILTLERRFPAYVPCETPKDAPDSGRPLAGIILLGGAISSQDIDGEIREDLGGSADRIRKAAQLAKEYPKLLVLVSGGQAFPRAGSRSEAVATADLLVELGVDLRRLRLETVSRTTAENAKFVAEQRAPQPAAVGPGAPEQAGSEQAAPAQADQGPWLLVTSAFHMPRSVGSFRKAGVEVIAVPTDWQVDDNRPLLTMNALDRLGKLDLGVHEYAGLIAYWITGRTTGILPGPREEDACPVIAPPPPKPAPENSAEPDAPAAAAAPKAAPKETPAEQATPKPASSQPAQVQPAQAQPTPAKSGPADSAPDKRLPMKPPVKVEEKPAPAKSTPAKPAATKSAPAKPASKTTTPAKPAKPN